MIRPFTVVTMLLAAGSGAYLFGVKHHAQQLDDQIADISQNSRLDGQRIRVLQAQWALETDPTRLQLLAAQFTTLQPMQPVQLVTLAALKLSLPPAGSAVPPSNPELPNEVPPAQELDASNAQPDAAQQDGGLPLPPPQAPVFMASAMVPAPVVLANPAAKAPVARPAHRAAHSALANSQWAEALPAPHPYEARPYAPAVEAAPRNMPMGAQVMSVKASASIPQYTPPYTPPYSRPYTRPAPVSADSSGSALGMGADLPPPQPLPSGVGN